MEKALSILFLLGFVSLVAGETGPFLLDWRVDGPLTAVCAAAGLAGRLLDSGPDHREWDGATLDPQTVNRFDRWAMSRYSSGLDRGARAFSLASAAAPAVLAFTDSDQWLTIGVMYAQSVILTGGMKNTLKGLVTRNRPYMYFDDPPLSAVEEGDHLNSFPSGHTAYAFNGAVFAGYVFSEYMPESPWKTPVIAGALGAAAVTGVLRLCGGSHFLSDVLAGAAIGSISGFAVPRLHRSRGENPGVSLHPLPSGGMITIRF